MDVYEIRQRLAKLVDACYDREALLVSQGIAAFTPALRFVEEVCRGGREIDEYRTFTIAAKRNEIARNNDFVARLEVLRSEADKRYALSGNIWDLELTGFTRLVQQLRAQDPQLLESRMRPYRERITELWNAEVERCSSAPGMQSVSFSRRHRMDSVMSMLTSLTVNSDFKRNAQSSKRGSIVFTSYLDANTEICLVIDKTELGKPILAEVLVVGTGATLRPGPTYVSHIEILLYAEGRAILADRIVIRFGALFPIHEFPLGGSCYSSFYSLRELEGLVVSFWKMLMIAYPAIVTALGGNRSRTEDGGPRLA